MPVVVTIGLLFRLRYRQRNGEPMAAKWQTNDSGAVAMPWRPGPYKRQPLGAAVPLPAGMNHVCHLSFIIDALPV